MYGIENKSTTSFTIISLSHQTQQKTQSQSSLEKLPYLSLDLSHQMSDIWLLHGLRRTRRDSDGGFIIESVNVGVSVNRYTTQPITGESGG
jgi:hypothetical protein